MQHVVLTVPWQMADEQHSGLDIPQPTMTKNTKKTAKSKGPKNNPATGRSPQAEELDQLALFQDPEYDDHAEEHHGDHDQGPNDLDLATEEAVHEAEEVLEHGYEEPGGATRVRRHQRRPRLDLARGMNLLLLAGWLILIPAVILMVVSTLAPDTIRGFLSGLSITGLTPAALTMIGIIVTGIGSLRGRQANIELWVSEVEATLADTDTGISASLDYLVEAQEHHLDRPPASGEELDRVLVVLQRQDEKVNNLTRAIKMYGKPLIEITKQLTDLGSRVESVRSSMGGIVEAVDGTGVEKALAKISNRLQRNIGGELDKILTEISNHSDEATMSSLEGLKQELSAVAANIAKLQEIGMAAARTVARTATAPAPAAAPAAMSGDGRPSQAATSGLSQSISGTKRSAGKGVLGSIAKLKKMRE